jgi:hypothetical protein
VVKYSASVTLLPNSQQLNKKAAHQMVVAVVVVSVAEQKTIVKPH